MKVRIWHSELFVPLFIFTVLSVLFCHSILSNLTAWGILDWDQHFFYHAVPRETIVRYHQFPLWNPYYCGGNVMLANMQARFLSPTFLFPLLFGTVVGVKIDIVFHIIVGMFGMFLLSRHFSMGPISSTLPSFIFMLSGMYALHLKVGHTWFMAIAYLPYVVYFYLLGLERFQYSIIAGAFVALMIFEGGIYAAPHSMLLLLFFSVLYALFSEFGRAAPLKAFGIVVLFTVLFSAVKLLPTMEFFFQHPRLIESSDFIPPKLFYYIFLFRTQHVTIHAGQPYGWWEYGSYIGFIPMLLGIIGILLYFRQQIVLILAGSAFFLLGVGDFGSMSPWHWLHRLPVFSSLHAPSRFFIVFIFMLSIMAGFCLSRLEVYAFKGSNWKKWVGPVASLALVVLVVCDLFLVNGKILAFAFTDPAQSPQRNEQFRQIIGHRDAMYSAFLRNEGTLKCYEPTHFPIKAIPFETPNYKGEVFLDGENGKADIETWSPNKVVVNIDVNRESRLLLNQNYAKGWKASQNREVESYKGLVSTKVTPKDTQITFYYLPDSFIVGTILSFFGIGLAFFLTRYARDSKIGPETRTAD